MRSHLLPHSVFRSIAIVAFTLGVAGCMEARREVPADKKSAEEQQAPMDSAASITVQQEEPIPRDGVPRAPETTTTTTQVDSAMAPEGAPRAPDRSPASVEQQQDQGILRVIYPTSRSVFVNGERIGRTNLDLTVPASNLMVDLGEPRDYSPGYRPVSVSPASLSTVTFTPRAQ